MPTWNDFHGPNAGYILELYEQYQRDPNAVDSATRAFFQTWQPPTLDGQPAPAAIGLPSAAPAPVRGDAMLTIVGVANLAQAIREYGHLAAQLDPLGSPPPDEPSLALDDHGLTEADLHRLPASLVGGPVAERTTTAWDAIKELRRLYSGSRTGYDFDHLRIPEVRAWLRDAVEADHYGPDATPIDEGRLLERLTQVEVFEHFIHANYPGKTRFSIEGLDMLIPMLDEVIGCAVTVGIYEILIGMAHRGRLNVLAHILEKPYREMLLEFKDLVNSTSQTRLSQLGWTGDVKYHAGAEREVSGGQARKLTVRMAPNPSHLEHVNPVVEGMARAAGSFVDQPGPPRQDQFLSLPIQIHGDAAFSGQGIVAETLNFTRLAGYSTGGTIHIIANNQIGFTTDPNNTRSTLYASDLAKGFKIPIVHVNADDPVASLRVARMAIAYRNHFKRDFFIDLIGYRRYGHNEGDEPRFTQPKMYAIIDKLPTVRQQWAEQLVKAGKVDADRPEALVQQQQRVLQEAQESIGPEEHVELEIKPPPPGAARKVHTAVPAETLRALHSALFQVPDGFHIHPRLQRIRRRAETALDSDHETTIDWSIAEQLAFASILAQGTAIRITGEDVKRGTFSHRHAVLFDAETGAPYTPLHHLPQAKAAFEIHNSPLSEAATIGFEYGYNIERPERLVLWEAQYGDFINVAQAIIDEFVVSGFAKWDQTPSLVLLLPHGYEGQGPDHSTGRLERFLQMAAEINMRIAYPTTAAQYFHLLRRQALLLGTDPLPLIVMTPKSLLRHPLSASSLRDLTESKWQPVLDDPLMVSSERSRDEVTRVILCSGKIYVDLVSSELRTTTPQIAILRVEQLYPFPAYELAPMLATYPKLTELVWVQEEPRNMGAWSAVKPQLETICDKSWPIRYIGRPRRANPAEGSAAWHKVNQAEIVKRAFEIN
ncbi:MAG: 2-oxoglutarate dehydrogenase E1 component [Caldilinea sp. CFX5]|nr:2-oxoglutarate dehydrogenase E1 component [Caldilinea sp. CFX5]